MSAPSAAPRRPLALGIDLGTSAVKALLVDAETLAPVAIGSAPCTVSAPRPGWSEQAPEEWWLATVAAVGSALALAAAHGTEGDTLAGRVVAIGLAGQMHGLVALDRQGAVVRPCILWNDQRSAEVCAALERRLGIATLVRLTGNRVHPGFTLPKLLWMREHEPQEFARIEQVLLPKDWLRWRLAGVLGHDVSDASGTSLFDPGRRDWSDGMLAACDLPRRWLPPVQESAEVAGTLTAEAATALGLRAGTPVVAGAGDQAAAALGLGTLDDGACSATIGTSGVVFVARAVHAPDDEGRLHAYCHAAPGRWHQMGVVLSAGGALRWFRDTLGRDAIAEAEARGIDPYEVLAERAALAPPGCDGLTFLPYLTGERTPHADPEARAAFIGLTLRHGPNQVARAVFEGITFALRDSLDLVRRTGAAPAVVRLAGGGARSPFWRQLCGDVFGCPVATLPATEGSAAGAALLAAVGGGVHPSAEAAVAALPQPEVVAQPNGSVELERARARFQERYGAARP